MNPKTADLLIKKAGLAILVEYVIMALHHVEGGLEYATPNRTFAPLTFAIPLLITFGLLYVYKTTRRGFALALFSITALLLWVGVIGLFEGGYNHTVKVAFYLTGVSPEVMERFFPSYEYVWPNDAFFETSGILESSKLDHRLRDVTVAGRAEIVQCGEPIFSCELAPRPLPGCEK